MSLKSPNGRRKYIINPRFQYRLMGYIVFIGIINIIGFYFCVEHFFYSFEQAALNVGLPAKHAFFNFMEQQKVYLGFNVLIFSVISTIVFVVSSFLISNKIAGPLYRLCEHLKIIDSIEQLTEVRFRKGDFFLEIQDYFNTMVRKLKGQK